MTEKSSEASPTLEATRNYDADIHILKGKISELVKDLPAYDEFKNFIVDTFEGERYEKRIIGLTKQRTKMLKAFNSIDLTYADFTATYETLIDEYRNAPSDSFLKKEMDKLEKKECITGLIRSMTSIRINLQGLKIEISENIDLVNLLHKPVDDTITKTEQGQPEIRRIQSNHTKVEPLRVPQFSGENYVEFIAGFDDLIHNNPMHSENSKAQYFKNAITGRAARCISGIPATGENYQLMYDKVKAKYSRVSSNQHSILRKLENLEVASNNSRSLEDKLDEIEEILNQLNTANIGIDDSTNPMWQRLILRKFPSELACKIVTKNHSNENFTVRDLLDEIEDETFGITFKEDAGFVNNNDFAGSREVAQGSQTNQQYRNNFLHGFAAKTSNVGIYHHHCVFCPNSDHRTDECPLQLQVKKNILIENKACWKCFKTDHGSHKCSLPNCDCGQNHHPTMCRQRSTGHQTANKSSGQFQPNSATYNSNVSFQSHPVIVEHVVPCQDPHNLQVYNTTIENHKNIPAQTVLMTCTSSVFNPDINRHVDASTFFDSGSQRTIVSEKFATSQNLKIIGTEQYVFSGINGDSDLIMGNIVEVKMKGIGENEIVINALTKELICQGFNAAKLDNNDLNFACEHKINFANSHVKGEKVCPDILIGADWYSKLVKNVPTIELPSGLRIVETLIGSTIFGVANNFDKAKEQQAKYANHSCIVKMFHKLNSEAASVVSHQVKSSRDSKSLKVNLGTEIMKQMKSKVSVKRAKIIILPKEILAVLKTRVVKPRNTRRASILKARLQTETYCNKPVGQTASLNRQNNSRVHGLGFLKKNEIDSNNLQTLNCCYERIHQAPVDIGMKMLKAIVNHIEKVNRKCIQ